MSVSASEPEYSPINAAGGVLLRYIAGAPHVLLILRNHKWDLPKGKQEDDETVRACARREVAEEVGINEDGVRLEHPLGCTLHRYEDKHGRFEKTTYWFLMASEASSFSPQTKEGITKTCWLPLEEAVELVAFDNLKTILRRTADFIREQRKNA